MKPKRKVRRVAPPPGPKGLLEDLFLGLGEKLDRTLRTKKLHVPGSLRPFALAGVLADGLVQGVTLGFLSSIPGIGPTDEAIRAAGGDVIEAMHGHKCGPECWHALGETPEARQKWWDDKLRRHDERYRKKKARP